MIHTAQNQVTTEAAMPIPTPSPTGRRLPALVPRKLAVIAATTRIASRPSRKTRSPLFRTTAPWLR